MDNMEEVNEGGENAGNGILETFASLYCAIFRKPGSCKSLKFLVTSITFLDPETVELLAFYVLSTMFKGVCGPPEKLSLALVQCLNVLCMIMKVVHKCRERIFDAV